MGSEPIRRSGVKHIADLPEPGPWSIARFGGVFLFTSPNHEPMVYEDGKLRPLTFPPPPGELT